MQMVIVPCKGLLGGKVENIDMLKAYTKCHWIIISTLSLRIPRGLSFHTHNKMKAEASCGILRGCSKTFSNCIKIPQLKEITGENKY